MLDGFYQHYGLEDCISFVARSLERAGMREEDLAPYQFGLLQDLPDPLDEEALAGMLSYWNFNLPRLLARGRDYLEDVPAKPKIEIFLKMTSKGNFKADWVPAGWRGRRGMATGGTDFLQFEAEKTRRPGYFTRPSNELFFIRNVEMAVSSLRFGSDRAPRNELSHVLLTACARVVERLKERLAPHFDVRMVTDILVEWEEGEPTIGGSSWDMGVSTITRWEIIDPEEPQRQAELLELAEMEARLGFSEAALAAAQEAESNRVSASGPAPSPHTLPTRLTRQLKKQGLAATEGGVKRALLLIDRNRAKSAAAGDNVVPFRA